MNQQGNQQTLIHIFTCVRLGRSVGFFLANFKIKIFFLRMSETGYVWEAYSYRLNMGVNVEFCVLFGLLSGYCLLTIHRCKVSGKTLDQQVNKRFTTMLIPFLVGLVLESVGYVGRIINVSNSEALGPYILQSITLLVAPAFMAASIYMNFGEVIKMYKGEKYCLIPLKWLTKIFVFGDVTSILIQAAGGGIQSTGSFSLFNIGKNMIIGGLFIQIFFFGSFVLSSFVYFIRYSKAGCSVSHGNSQWLNRKSWRYMIANLFIVCCLILVRSTYRVIEYLQGYGGELLRLETYLFVLDSTMIFFGAVIYLIADVSNGLTTLAIVRASNGEGQQHFLVDSKNLNLETK